jgi:hypothetical protein
MSIINSAVIQRSTASYSRPSRTTRVLAAASYLLGSFALIVVAIGPRNPFLIRHAQQGMVLHVARLVLVSGTLLTWYVTAEIDESTSVSAFALHFAALVLLGVPWPTETSGDLMLSLGLPLGGIWVMAMTGAMISALGLSLDVRAAVSARWPEWIDDSEPEIGTPEYDRRIGLRGSRPELYGKQMSAQAQSEFERGLARDLRDKRLERIWHASRHAIQERSRQEIIQELEKRQETVLVRLDHLNHLLSSGSISLTRYNRFSRDLVEYLDGLRSVRAQLRTRADGGSRAYGELPETPNALTDAPDAEAITLAIIDSTGIPVVTYGHFTTDESLISGMVSVMDGLSEEMFGSRANATRLADGEVVYFAKGQFSSAFLTFDDEPSPVQVSQLREYLDLFERTNYEQLQRNPIDPMMIEEVPVPFRFARRISTHSSAAQVRLPASSPNDE